MGNAWAKFGGFVAFMLATTGIAGAVDEHGIFSSAVASWVQGVGTIAAVVVAVLVGQAPLRAAAADRRRKRRDFLRALKGILDYTKIQVRPAQDAIGARSDFRLINAKRMLGECGAIEAFDKLLAEPLEQWPSQYLWIRTNIFRSQLIYLRDVDVINDPPEYFWPSCEITLTLVEGLFANLFELVQDGLKE